MTKRFLRIGTFVSVLTILLSITSCADGNATAISAGKGNNAAQNANTRVEYLKGDEQEISTLLDQYNDALLKSDAAVLDRIWADDLSFVNLRGQLLTKKERMENIKTGATELKSAQVSEKNVRMYGSTAVATLVVKIDGQYSGQEGSGSFRITTVWAKPKDNWQMVATQMTPIAK